MLKDKITAFVGKVQPLDGVAACARVSRDGIIAGKISSLRRLSEAIIITRRSTGICSPSQKR